MRLRGGGTKDFWDQSLTGDVLDTRAYRGIVSYEPSELVVTVRCGTPLAEFEAALYGVSLGKSVLLLNQQKPPAKTSQL